MDWIREKVDRIKKIRFFTHPFMVQVHTPVTDSLEV